jgi:hypothetical protein
MQQKRKVAIFLVGFVFCLLIIIGMALTGCGTNYNDETQTNGGDKDKTCTIGEAPIYFDSEQVRFESKEITALYAIQDSKDIISIDFENNGIDVLNYELIPENKIYLYMNYDYSVDEHIMSMFVNLYSGETLTARLYAINNDCGIFISPYSVESAYEKYFSYGKSIGILSQEQIQAMRNELYSSCVTDNSYDLAPGVEYEFPITDNSVNEMPEQG